MADENDINLKIKPELTMDDAKKQLKDFEKNIAEVYLSLGKTFQTQLTQISVMMEHFKPILSEIKASGSLLNAQVKKTALKDTDYKKALRTNVATSLDEGIIKGKALVTKRNTSKGIQLETLRLQKTNQITSGLIQQDNYQSLINQKVENQLNASIAQKKALLENIGLKKEEAELQKQINTELKGSEDSVKRQTKNQVSLVTQLRRMFAGVYVVKRFASIFTDMVNLSGDWVENLNLFVVSFGQDFYKESLDWANDFSQRLGASVNEIVKLTANFRQLTSAIGYAQEISDSLSRTLTSLAYDLTSYYNLTDVDTAYTKLSSGVFSGQVKTLRSLGIDVSAESITTYLKELSGTYSEFIGITNAGLDQSQKVLARTLLVMKSATNSFGDMSRSIETFSNRQRVFIASIENLKLALGDLASDTISTLLAYMNGFIRAVTTIIRVFKPLKETLDYEVGGTVLGALNEDAEEAQKNLNKLSFDKFETLTGGDDSKGQLGITEALTKELEKQIALYNEQASQYEGIDKTAQSVYNSIIKWVYPLSTIDEETGAITLNTEEMNGLIGNVVDAFKELEPILLILKDIAIESAKIVAEYKLLDEIIYLIMAYSIVSKLTNLYKGLSKIHIVLNKNMFVLLPLVVVVAEIIALMNNWADMNFAQKIVSVLGIITSAIGALAISIMILKGVTNTFGLISSITAIVAGIGMIVGAIGTIPKIDGYANGGSLDMGTQIWGMNEKGNPEFMFNAGGYDSVINADILERAIANGTASAIASSGLLDRVSQSLVIKGDNIDNSAFARAIFPALQKESTRLGGNKL
jgi:hypothetical protein